MECVPEESIVLLEVQPHKIVRKGSLEVARERKVRANVRIVLRAIYVIQLG